MLAVEHAESHHDHRLFFLVLRRHELHEQLAPEDGRLLNLHRKLRLTYRFRVRIGSHIEEEQAGQEVPAHEVVFRQALILHFELAVVPFQVLPPARDYHAPVKLMNRQHELSALPARDCRSVQLLHVREVLLGFEKLCGQLGPCLVVPLLSGRVEVSGDNLSEELCPLWEVPLQALDALTACFDFLEECHGQDSEQQVVAFLV